MRRARVWIWAGGIAGVALWAGCNQILGTGEPIVTGAGGSDTVGGGGNGGTGTTISNGGNGTTSQAAGGGCTDDLEWAQWVFPEPVATSRFATGAGESITDDWTGLTWTMNAVSVDVTADMADMACQPSGGRLPTRIELLSIVDYSKTTPGTIKLYSPFFGQGVRYWTSTVSTEQQRWVVDFQTGLAGPESAAMATADIRCVLP
jgi:hypothetical protein